MNTEEAMAQMIATVRQSALVVFQRRARANHLTITVCGTCCAYLAEREGDGSIERGACLEHIEPITRSVQ